MSKSEASFESKNKTAKATSSRTSHPNKEELRKNDNSSKLNLSTTNKDRVEKDEPTPEDHTTDFELSAVKDSRIKHLSKKG